MSTSNRHSFKWDSRAAKPRPPKLTPPANVTAEAPGPSGAIVTYPPAKASGAKSVAYSKKSGSLFPLGATVVTVTAKSRDGATAKARFTVRVVDTTAPAFAPAADVTAPATSPAGAPVSYAVPSATDGPAQAPALHGLCDGPEARVEAEHVSDDQACPRAGT